MIRCVGIWQLSILVPSLLLLLLLLNTCRSTIVYHCAPQPETTWHTYCPVLLPNGSADKNIHVRIFFFRVPWPNFGPKGRGRVVKGLKTHTQVLHCRLTFILCCWIDANIFPSIMCVFPPFKKRFFYFLSIHSKIVAHIRDKKHGNKRDDDNVKRIKGSNDFTHGKRSEISYDKKRSRTDIWEFTWFSFWLGKSTLMTTTKKDT